MEEKTITKTQALASNERTNGLVYMFVSLMNIGAIFANIDLASIFGLNMVTLFMGIGFYLIGWRRDRKK